MRFPGNTVTLSDTRPSGGGIPQHCFYCDSSIGGPHKDDCVIIHRPIKIRVSIDLIVSRPRSWSATDIEFHMNDSTWCIDNILDDIRRHITKDYCLCGRSHITMVGEATLDEAMAVGLIPDSETDEEGEE